MSRNTGWVFWLVPPRKVLSMELVPPNREKWLSSPKVAKKPFEKVKVQVRVCQTFTFYCNLAGTFFMCGRVWLWLSLFSRDIAIFGELSHFFTIGWAQFHTFLGGTSKKNTLYHIVKLWRCLKIWKTVWLKLNVEKKSLKTFHDGSSIINFLGLPQYCNG